MGISLGLLLLAHVTGAAPYRIGPGDVLHITIWQEDDLTGNYTVSKKGTISLNWMEPIEVEGLTLDEAKEKIKTAVTQYVRQPVVTMSIAQHRSKKITVLGEVSKPGQYYLKNDSSLLHIILTEVGGPTNQAGDTIDILRLKDKGENQEIENITRSLSKLMHGDATQNLELQNSDTILIPRYDSKGMAGYTADSVFVLGEVTQKGTYKVRNGYTVLNAILDAGGFTKFASRNRVKVIRIKGDKKEEHVVRMKDVMIHGDKSKDMAIVPGDFIIVPKSLL